MATAASNAVGSSKPGAFTSKYGTGDIDASEWGDDTCKALRDAGFKIVRFGPIGFLYVGQCNAQNIPDGQGYLYQPAGERHEGQFQAGRAHGVGAFFANGKEWRGTWDQNKRVGTFAMTAANGVKWTEKYSLEGKRTSRVKVREDAPNPDWTEGAVNAEGEPVPQTIRVEVAPDEEAAQCWQCNQKGRDANNHAWACRSHKGSWAFHQTFKKWGGEGEAPGVWSCCGSEKKDEPGCSFQECNFQGKVCTKAK